MLNKPHGRTGARIQLWILVAGLTTTMWARPAEAKCGCEDFFIGPSSGDVPPDPELYLFELPGRTPPELHALAGSVELPVRRVRLDVPGPVCGAAYVVSKLEVTTGQAAQFSIAGRTFTVNRAWRPAVAKEARFAPLSYVYDSPFVEGDLRREALVATPLVDAAIYRVEWAASDADYAAGRRHKVLLVPTGARLLLGRISGCLESLSPSTVASPVALGVSALFPDGSEAPASPAPISTLHLDTFFEWMRRAGMYGTIQLVALALVLAALKWPKLTTPVPAEAAPGSRASHSAVAYALPLLLLVVPVVVSVAGGPSYPELPTAPPPWWRNGVEMLVLVLFPAGAVVAFRYAGRLRSGEPGPRAVR